MGQGTEVLVVGGGQQDWLQLSLCERKDFESRSRMGRSRRSTKHAARDSCRELWPDSEN